MYASDTTDTVTIQSAKGPVVVTIQRLNWKTVKKASQIVYEASVLRVSRATASTSGEALVAALADRAKRKAEQERAAAEGKTEAEKSPEVIAALHEARYHQYDQETVLRGGIRSSSDGKSTAALIDDLDEAPADALHRAILDLTLPPIDEKAREAERKNG